MSTLPDTVVYESADAATDGAHTWLGFASSQLLRPSLLSIVDQGIVSVANFLSVMIIASAATEADYGVYHLALMIVLSWRLVQDQMVGVPLTIYRPRFRARRGKVYSSSCVALQVAVLLVVETTLLVGLGIANWLQWKPAFQQAILLAAVVTPPMLLRELARKHCFAHFYFRTAIGIDLIASCVQIAGLYYLAHNARINAFSSVMMLSLALSAGVLCWAATRPGDFRFGIRYWKQDWLLHWRFGRWASLSQLISNAGPLFANWYVTQVHSEAETARVGVALAMIGAINIVLVGIANWLGPFAARELNRRGTDAMIRKTALVTLPLVAAMGLFALLMYWIGTDLAAFLFSSKFSGMGGAIAVASLSLTFTMFSLGAICGLSALGRSQIMLPADIAFSVIIILNSWWMVPIWGVVGVFAANVLGAAAQGCIRWRTLIVAARTYRRE